MTKQQLKRERAMERARARIVRAELLRMKRVEQIKSKAEEIFTVFTAIALLGLLIIALVVDSLTVEAVPSWVYIIGFIYLSAYGLYAFRRFFR